MAEAEPVFIVSGVVFALLAIWAGWVNLRGGRPWARPETRVKPGVGVGVDAAAP